MNEQGVQEMNDKLDILGEKLNTVSTDQKVLSEAFSRHEVQDERNFATLSKGLDEAHEFAGEVSAQSIERDRTFAAQAKENFQNLHDAIEAIQKDVTELKAFVWKFSSAFAVIVFLFQNFDAIKRMLG